MGRKRVRYFVHHSSEARDMSVGEYVSHSLNRMSYLDVGQVEQVASEVEDLRNLVVRLVDALEPLLPVAEIDKLIGDSPRFSEDDREVVEVPDA